MNNPHARLSDHEREKEARTFLAWYATHRNVERARAFEQWAAHLLPGDWHRVRAVVDERLRKPAARAA